MHFRHFLLSGLMVGAALLIPDNVFAEKNEHSGQENTQKVNVQANIQMDKQNVQAGKNMGKAAEQAEQVTEQVGVITEKAAEQAEQVTEQVGVITEKAADARANVQKNMDRSQEKMGMVHDSAKIEQEHVEVTLPARASEKANAGRKELPKQAKEHLQGVKAKAKVTIEAPGLVQEEGKNPHAAKNKAENLVTVDHAEKTKSPSAQIVEVTKTPKSEGLVTSLFSVEQEDIPKAQQQRDEQNPTKKEEAPKASQITSQQSRSNNANGPSTDRFSHGVSQLSLVDKWLVWNTSYDIELVQPFVSRSICLHNQWVNAPPSPPPKESSDINIVSVTSD